MNLQRKYIIIGFCLIDSMAILFYLGNKYVINASELLFLKNLITAIKHLNNLHCYVFYNNNLMIFCTRLYRPIGAKRHQGDDIFTCISHMMDNRN